jgi:signal peptidase I
MAERTAGWWAKGALSAIGGIIFGLLFGAALAAVIATYLGDYHIITVRTGSMEPELEKGEIVVVRPVRIDKIDEEDVIYFKSEGAPTVHRVVAIREEVLNIVDSDTGEQLSERHNYFFTTKGDANPENDGGEVTLEEYQGRVWFSVPTFGLLGSSVSPTWIMLALAGGIGVLWGGYEFLVRGRRAGVAKRPRRRGRAIPQAQQRQERRVLAPRTRPSFARRATVGVAGALDAALYTAIGVGRSIASSLKPRPVRGIRWARVPAGAGMWILVPMVLWLSAVGVILGSSALAGDGPRWDGDNQVSSDIQVRGGPSPSPQLDAASKPSASPTCDPTNPAIDTPTEEPTEAATPEKPATDPVIEVPEGSPSPEASVSPEASPSPEPSPSPAPNNRQFWDSLGRFIGGKDDFGAGGESETAEGCEDAGKGGLIEDGTPLASATPTPTASASPTDDPDASPSPSEEGDDPGDQPAEGPTDEPTGDPTEEPTVDPGTPEGDPSSDPIIETTETSDSTAEAGEPGSQEPEADETPVP